jgi:hypothetical protein
MTSEDFKSYQDRKTNILEEICENTRAIRRVTNRILDHIHEYQTGTEASSNSHYDPDELSWEDLDSNDDMYS